MMSPVWTPACPPPHPSTVSPYSSDAQIVLRALQAKYGYQLKKEEPHYHNVNAPSPYQQTYGEEFRYHVPSTIVKQEPVTPRPDTSRNDLLHNRRDRSLEQNKQNLSSSISGRCELLLTQTHTTDYVKLDEEDNKVQALLQEGPRSSLHVSHIEGEKQTPPVHTDGKFPHQNFSAPKCVSTPLLCQDNSDINMLFPYGLTCAEGSPPIDLSPPCPVIEEQGSADKFPFLAPFPVHLKKKQHISNVSGKGGQPKLSHLEAEFMERRGCDVKGRVTQLADFAKGLFDISLSSSVGDVPPRSNKKRQSLTMSSSHHQDVTDQDDFYYKPGCDQSKLSQHEDKLGDLSISPIYIASQSQELFDTGTSDSLDSGRDRPGTSSVAGHDSSSNDDSSCFEHMSNLDCSRDSFEVPLSVSLTPQTSNKVRSMSSLTKRVEKFGSIKGVGHTKQPKESVKRRPVESGDEDLKDIENLLNNVPAPPKRKCAGFKVPVKPKKAESTRQSKITETVTTYPMNRPRHIQPGTIDVTKLTSERFSWLFSEIRDASEISITLSYQNGATQLREALIEKKRGSKIEEKLSGLNFTTFRDNAASIYYVPFDTGSSDYFEIGREVLMNLMDSGARKICYCAQDCIKATIVQFNLSHADVVNKLVMMDPKIACWLTDADNPPASFKQVLTKCGMEQKESGSLQDDLKQLSSVMPLLYQRLTAEGQWSLFFKLETRLTPILSLMELRGIKINTETLVEFGELLKKKTMKVEAAAHRCAGHQFLINSHPQLRQLLFEELKLDTKLPAKAKIARTSVSHQKSTSETVLNQLKDVHPLPGLILEYRQFQKLKSTYVDGMLIYVKDDYLHTSWDQTAAATGRLTSSNPNVQAIPKQPVELTGVVDNFIVGRDSETVTIYMRDPFVSQEGWSLLAADFKQIELRLLAHLADDPALLQAFNESDCKDIFIELTKQWLGKGYSDITTSDREQTKRVVYSVMYGVGKERLADYLKTSPDTAKAIMQSFLVRFPCVKSFTNQSIETCRQKGFTQTIFKRRRLIPNIQHTSPVLRAQAERQAVNFCVQGSAADLCKAALVQVEYALVARKHLKSRLLIQIHDELLLEVPDDEISEVKDLVKTMMESSEGLCGDLVKLKVPLRVSLTCGKTWGHMESL